MRGAVENGDFPFSHSLFHPNFHTQAYKATLIILYYVHIVPQWIFTDIEIDDLE